MRKLTVDRRRRKSQTAIQNALLSLLETIEFEMITVQEVVDVADMSRMTFYAYYADKLDLLDQMEDDSIAPIRQRIQELHEESRKPTDMIKMIMSYLVHHISENMRFYHIMFQIGNASMLKEKLYQLLYGHLSNYTERDGTLGDFPFPYFMSYVSGAGISLLEHWVLDEERITEENLIYHFMMIITEGPASYLK